MIKRLNSEKLISQLQALEPIEKTWDEYAGSNGQITFPDTAQELDFLRTMLENAGINRIYYKVLVTEEFGHQSLSVVKVIVPQLEGVFLEYWRSNGRATAMLAKEMERLTDNVRRHAD